MVLFVDPSQQKSLKHFLQASGTEVLVRSKERLRIAQLTQVDQVESRVELPMVATSAPFVMIMSRAKSE